MRSSLLTRIGTRVAGLLIAQTFLSMVLGLFVIRVSGPPPRQHVVDQGIALARLAATGAPPGDATRDRLDELADLQGFALVLYDAEGHQVYTTAPGVPSDAWIPPAERARLRGLEGQPLLLRGNLPREPTAALASLPAGSDAAFVGIFESATYDRLAKGFRTALVAQAAALLAVALLITVWITKRVRLELQKVEWVVTCMAAGQLNQRLAVHGEDELSRVADGFNRMADRLSMTIRELQDAHAKRTRMFAAFTHELATPLTSVLGYLESLCMPEIDAEPETRRRYAKTAYEQACALRALVDDLTALSQLDFDGLAIVAVGRDLQEIVRAEVRPFETRGESRCVRFHVETPAKLQCELDPDRFGQVVRNLLDNALRHSPDGSVVHVMLAEHGDEAVFRVRDEGSGVPPAELPLLGEPLLRGDPSRSRSSGGRGLGLAIAAAIVRAHRGSITFRSEPGAGLDVEVRLPRRAVAALGRIAVRDHESPTSDRPDAV